MKKLYVSPAVVSEGSFETSALACAKTADPPPGSWHVYTPYDTFTGHFGPGFGAHQSATGSVGIGFGPGGTSLSYFYSGLCINWVTLAT
jgi:hypothetical protein